jgi:hypothetical protein
MANYRKDTIYQEAFRHYWHLSVAYGFKAYGDFSPPKYGVAAASALYGYRVSKINKLLIGLDYFHDNSLINEEVYIRDKVAISRIGIFFGNEFILDRLGLFFGVGQYIFKQTPRNANNYIKVGLRYHVYKNIFTALVLKTHYGQADNFELTIGYTFKK